MKKFILRNKFLIGIFLGFFLGVFILQARSGANLLTSSAGDKFSASKRNQFVSLLDTAIGWTGPDSLTVQPGDKLTTSKWNALVTKLGTLSGANCGTGTVLQNGSCVITLTGCSIPNGVGQQIYSGGTIICNPTSCNAGYQLANGTCYDNYTKLLLHFDNNIADTVNINTLSNNSATFSNSINKFGGYSVYFNGSTSLSLPNSSDWDFGGGDFTIDFRMYPTAFPTYGGIFVHVQTESSHGMWIEVDSGQLRFFARNNSTEIFQEIATSGGAISLNTWYHVAAVRSGNNWYLFLNGNLVNTFSSSSSIPTYSAPVQIGIRGGYGGFQGYIDEMRVSKGIARRTSSFTPPTSPY